MSNRFMFSKTLADSDLFKHNGIKELLNYISEKDADLNNVKVLIKKANRELRTDSRHLFIRKASSQNKEAVSRICMTRR